MKLFEIISIPLLLLIFQGTSKGQTPVLDCLLGGLIPPSASSIKFKLWIKIRPSGGIATYNDISSYSAAQIKDLIEANGYGDKKTDVYFHDFGSNGQADWIITNKNNFMTLGDNPEPIIISVDYQNLAKTKNAAISNSELISNRTAEVIKNVQNAFSLLSRPNPQINLIGHGMGAIIAAETSVKAFQPGKGYIFVALAPEIIVTDSNGMVNVCNKNVKVSQITKSLATKVIVLHTGDCLITPPIPPCDSTIYETMGHVDYFPDGGANQTQCTTDDCNKTRAVDLFVKANSHNLVSSITIYSDVCQNYAKYKANDCYETNQPVDFLLSLLQENGRNYFSPSPPPNFF